MTVPKKERAERAERVRGLLMEMASFDAELDAVRARGLKLAAQLRAEIPRDLTVLDKAILIVVTTSLEPMSLNQIHGEIERHLGKTAWLTVRRRVEFLAKWAWLQSTLTPTKRGIGHHVRWFVDDRPYRLDGSQVLTKL